MLEISSKPGLINVQKLADSLTVEQLAVLGQWITEALRMAGVQAKAKPREAIKALGAASASTKEGAREALQKRSYVLSAETNRKSLPSAESGLRC